MGKKKKVLATKAKTTVSKKGGGHPTKEERRAHKLERRKKEKRNYTADDWAVPAPSHLVAKLDVPKVKSKYQSYFEFADNPEKKEKRLEFTVGAFSLLSFITTNPRHRSPMMLARHQALSLFRSETRSSPTNAKSSPEKEMQ